MRCWIVPARLCLTLLLWLATLTANAQTCDDPALVRAAAEALSTGERDLVQLARRTGSDLPTVRGLELADGDDPPVRRFLDELAASSHAPLACGQASSEGRRLIIAGARAATLQIEDEVARIALAPGWHDARLYLRDALGEARSYPIVEGRAEIPSDLARPLDIQVVATGPDGPRPVAERIFGTARERVVVDSDEPLARRIDRLRQSAGVGLLRPNRLLGEVATRHAVQLCREARVGHLGAGGDPVERLARQGIVARHVGETAARSRDIASAYAATLQSPSHRAALVDRRFTDVGVGVARGRCLVVLLAAWPRAVPYNGRR